MSLGVFKFPAPYNEPVYSYVKGSPERDALIKEIENQKNNPVEIPLIIGGKEIKTGDLQEIRSPHNRSLLLGKFHQASSEHVKMAIEAAAKARKEWSQMPMEDRAGVFLKAADLLSSHYRDILNAATMLGQSKNMVQAEIDSACELIDFFRFNVKFMMDIYQIQPLLNTKYTWNRTEYRALEGFVFAVTPFNFTAIGGNLPSSPALMGNVVLWKPANTAVLSAYYTMKLFKAAGLPDGVINFIPGKSSEIGPIVVNNPAFAGLHFTGSTAVFNTLWSQIGANLKNNVYKNYPRIVGETGGKDFIFAHPECEHQELAVAAVRGAFEYQGQKCSAASRAYIPKSIWPCVKEKMLKIINEIKVGDVTEDFSLFMGAVIDQKAFKDITGYIDYAKSSSEAEIIAGGKYDDSKGYFVDPTVIVTTNPKFKTMEEEIFGPVLTIYVYEDADLDATLTLLDETSPYALTGAIFANDRLIIQKLMRRLENCAGNFYVNDKPTGAVVGQQPFGGGRASGTNDKAGSMFNLLRWVNNRTIKENFVTPRDYRYPHMD